MGAYQYRAGAASLRKKILFAVCSLVLICLMGSTLSLLRITEVSRVIDSVNRFSVPFSKLLAQLQTDSELYRREIERRLGYAHWNAQRADALKKPIDTGTPSGVTLRAVPKWIEDLIEGELSQAQNLVARSSLRDLENAENDWPQFIKETVLAYQQLKAESARIALMIEQKRDSELASAYPHWQQSLDAWLRQVKGGATESDRELRLSFTSTEGRVHQLRLGLEVILLVIFGFSLLLFWFGERALRPLSELADLARSIARRGGEVTRGDKTAIPHDVIQRALSRSDEVSQLVCEFHSMATALSEREKSQREMGELKERLQQAERLAGVGRLSAQVAHEVRNPLHSIGLEAEMTADLIQDLSPHSVLKIQPLLKSSVQSILSSVNRLEKITENYLKMSRLSKGEKKIFDMNECFQSVLAMYASVCESQSVKIEWNATGVLLVRGDRELMEQALGNLLKNSLQALEVAKPEQPEVHWRLTQVESGRVLVQIQDNGPGLSSEIVSRLFEPFVTTRAQGTGLGLSFIKKVVEDFSGVIQYRKANERHLQGACFELLIPSAAPSQHLSVEGMKNEEALHVES